jgi:hypothetical protein
LPWRPRTTLLLAHERFRGHERRGCGVQELLLLPGESRGRWQRRLGNVLPLRRLRLLLLSLLPAINF